MSGHSKWSTIKHKKAATDAKKSKLFSKLSSLISLAAKTGGDPAMNPNLRLIIEKAKAGGMTKDNIDRAIKRGTGELGGDALEEITYEAYGPGGVGIIIEAVTDNKNRTVSEIRALLNKYNGKLADTGSVLFQFTKKGVISIVVQAGQNGDDLFLAAIDAGAEDVVVNDDSVIIYTTPQTMEQVKQTLINGGYTIVNAEVQHEPSGLIPVPTDNENGLLQLLESLDDLDDITNVATNADL